MINRILHSWSFQMKFIKQRLVSHISYEMTTRVRSSNCQTKIKIIIYNFDTGHLKLLQSCGCADHN